MRRTICACTADLHKSVVAVHSKFYKLSLAQVSWSDHKRMAADHSVEYSRSKSNPNQSATFDNQATQGKQGIQQLVTLTAATVRKNSTHI